MPFVNFAAPVPFSVSFMMLYVKTLGEMKNFPRGAFRLVFVATLIK